MSVANDGAYRLTVMMRVSAEGEAALLEWLTGGHLAEVAAQPGFLSAELVKAEPADGLNTYLASYRVESRAAFDRYEADLPLKQRFAAERSAFDRWLSVDRWAGPIVAEAGLAQ